MSTHRSIMRACGLLVLVAPGCGDGGGGSTDVEATLRFADRSDPEIGRLISAAAGTDMFSAQAQVDNLADTFEPDPCPAIAIDGLVATMTGGCTRRDGTEVRGSAVVTNPLGWDQVEYEFTRDSHYELQQLVIVDGTFEQSFDGYVETADSMTVAASDVTVASFGVTVRSDLHYTCSNPSAPRCSLSGSGLELIGAGGAHVSGTVTVDPESGRQTASFTLRGADTLTVHTDGTCIEWSISGTDRKMECP